MKDRIPGSVYRGIAAATLVFTGTACGSQPSVGRGENIKPSPSLTSIITPEPTSPTSSTTILTPQEALDNIAPSGFVCQLLPNGKGNIGEMGKRMNEEKGGRGYPSHADTKIYAQPGTDNKAEYHLVFSGNFDNAPNNGRSGDALCLKGLPINN